MSIKMRRRSNPVRRPQHPALRFTPRAWAKLLFLRDQGETEVGGFGLSAMDDLLLVEDLVLLPQLCSSVHVSFPDEAVADYFDTQYDLGHRPEQFARIWIHTHPADCPQPSGTDEETFSRVFGTCRWAVMAILARGGQSYARIRFDVGNHSEWELPMEVDYHAEFGGTNHAAWRSEYAACVQVQAEWNWKELQQLRLADDFGDLISGSEEDADIQPPR